MVVVRIVTLMGERELDAVVSIPLELVSPSFEYKISKILQTD